MSIFDHPGQARSALTWRCPECRTIQAQATHCWRCSTPVHGCDTCRHYRPSVADGLGHCAADATSELVPADGSRRCWESPVGPAATPPDTVLRTAAERPPRPVKPPLEEPGRAAWVEPDEDRLVDAPVVEPGQAITTEVRRRRWRWFG